MTRGSFLKCAKRDPRPACNRLQQKGYGRNRRKEANPWCSVRKVRGPFRERRRPCPFPDNRSSRTGRSCKMPRKKRVIKRIDLLKFSVNFGRSSLTASSLTAFAAVMRVPVRRKENQGAGFSGTRPFSTPDFNGFRQQRSFPPRQHPAPGAGWRRILPMGGRPSFFAGSERPDLPLSRPRA